MSRALCAVVAVVVLGPLLARADGAAPIRVAVYGYPTDLTYTLSGAFAAEPAVFAATDVTARQVAAGLDGFDCLVARLGPAEPAEVFPAIAGFVARGGCYVGDWWGAGAAFSSIAPTALYPPPGVLGLFPGEVDGRIISIGWPVQLTVAHPVTDGLPQTFNLSDGSECFARPLGALDSRLQVIATTTGYDLSTQPALLVGSTGRANVVLILFDAGDAAYAEIVSDKTSYYANASRLFRNAVRWAATAPVDRDPPITSASFTGKPGKNGWWVSAVTVTLAASDGPWGTGVAFTEYAIDGAGWVRYAGPFTVGAEGTTQVAWRSTDVAGNVEDAKTQELRIDEDRPAIALASPRAGAVYALRQPGNASWTATDAVSGTASTTATAASGAPFDTSSVGAKTFEVAAEDLAGNAAAVDAGYAVQYVFGGWQRPLVADGSGVYKLQRTIPLRFELLDWSGAPVSTAVARLRIYPLTSDVIGTTEVDTGTTSAPTVDDRFRWDDATQSYVYSLSPRSAGLTVGTWELQVLLDDGTTYRVEIGLR